MWLVLRLDSRSRMNCSRVQAGGRNDGRRAATIPSSRPPQEKACLDGVLSRQLKLCTTRLLRQRAENGRGGVVRVGYLTPVKCLTMMSGISDWECNHLCHLQKPASAHLARIKKASPAPHLSQSVTQTQPERRMTRAQGPLSRSRDISRLTTEPLCWVKKGVNAVRRLPSLDSHNRHPPHRGLRTPAAHHAWPSRFSHTDGTQQR